MNTRSPAASSVRNATNADAEALARIYNHYIANTHVTFETEAITGDDMNVRVADTQAASLPWLVAEFGGEVAGFAYASKWKGRCAYRYSVESTIYLDPQRTGMAIGTPLYTALIDEVRGLGMHSMIGGIALPNDASIGLHEKLGFTKIGEFAEVGNKFERWIDVGYWQLLL